MLIQDKVLFSKIYNANYDHLLYTAVKIIRNFSAAEDLVNETFFILLTQFDKIQHHPNIVGWLHTVLTNLTSNELKNKVAIYQFRQKKFPEQAVRTISSLSMIVYQTNFPKQRKKF